MHSFNTQVATTQARIAVIVAECDLGFELADRKADKLGYDIESRVLRTGKLCFIEVKGRVQSALTVMTIKNEILVSLNKLDNYDLAIMEFQDDSPDQVHYLRQPSQRDSDFDVTSVEYDLSQLLARVEAPA